MNEGERAGFREGGAQDCSELGLSWVEVQRDSTPTVTAPEVPPRYEANCPPGYRDGDREELWGRDNRNRGQGLQVQGSVWSQARVHGGDFYHMDPSADVHSIHKASRQL